MACFIYSSPYKQNMQMQTLNILHSLASVLWIHTSMGISGYLSFLLPAFMNVELV